MEKDNTNPSTEVRKEWIDLARSFKIPARCVHFTAPAALCRHNDAVRAANPSLVRAFETFNHLSETSS